MSSAEELIARIDAAKKSVEENQAALSSAAEGINASISELSAVKSEAEDLSSQLAGLSIEDRAVLAQEVAAKLGEAEAAASSWKTGSENQTAQGDGIQTTLDEAIAQAQGLGGLSHGASGGSPPTQTPQQAQAPAGSEPSGEKLLEMSDDSSKGFNAFTKHLFSDDASDSVQSVAETVENMVNGLGIDLNPPEAGTVAEVSVPSSGPTIHAQQQNLGAGDAATAVLAVSVVVMKTSQKVGDTISRFRKNRRTRD